MLLTIMGPEILETGEEYRAFLELEGEVPRRRWYREGEVRSHSTNGRGEE